LLIASQTDTSALRGKLGIIACKDEHERRAIMSVLNALDMAVTSVSTAQEALNLLEEEPVDLLVMDVRFEDMHGWAMIGKLREIDHTVGTRLIVLAEQEVDEQVFALTVAKVDAYLPKPLSLPLLRQHVWALLKENAMDKPS
jgi:DNA-binding response OmpR family regulator